MTIVIAATVVSGCGVLRDSPPPVTPIYITATPLPPAIPIVATETPSPTAVMVATSAALLPTSAPIRTATPTTRPPITMTPTFTPTTTNTPVTPGVIGFAPVGGLAVDTGGGGGCATVPPGVFGAIFQGDPSIQAAIGCPLAPVASAVGSAYQPFQNGMMIWVSSVGGQPAGAIYALYNNGTYQRFNDTFREGVDQASGGAVPPQGLLEPVRGFGKVWRDNANARDTLGWASSGESGGSAQILLFERGEMVGVSQTGQIYIMIAGAPGTWTARSG
jgi:serine/threonine-protein kinase